MRLTLGMNVSTQLSYCHVMPISDRREAGHPVAFAADGW